MGISVNLKIYILNQNSISESMEKLFFGNKILLKSIPICLNNTSSFIDYWKKIKQELLREEKVHRGDRQEAGPKEKTRDWVNISPI